MTTPKREFTLSYPIAKVKEALENAISLPGQSILDKNDTIGTYRFSLSGANFNTAIVQAQLTPINDDHTSCIFEVYNSAGSRLPVSIISGMQEKFVNIFTGIVTGEQDFEELRAEKIKQSGKSGLRLIIVFVVLLVVGGYILYKYLTG